MKTIIVIVLSLFFLVLFAKGQNLNPCELGQGCCFDIDFENTPGDPASGDPVPLQEGYEVLQGVNNSPWAIEQGIQFTLGSEDVRPGTTWKWPLSLLNVSNIPNSAPWAKLFSSTQGLVLTAAQQLSPTLIPLSGSWTLHVYSLRRPICLEKIQLLRSWGFSTKMTEVIISLYDSSENLLDEKTFMWGLSVQDPLIDLVYSTSNVYHIKVRFISTQGWGAFAFLGGCFARTSIDQCGVCGGINYCVPPIMPGDPCTVTKFSDPSCRDGHYILNGTSLECISDLAITGVEICNGKDDNCNGLIDEDQPMVECGVGACWRMVSSCFEGHPQACVPGTPTPEICNGIDDDCDGLIDEGGVCENNNSQPLIAELRVTPALSCVRTLTVSTCIAKFGYSNSDATKNYTFLFDGLHNALFYPLGDGNASPMNVPVTLGSVPTHFPAGASVAVAFECSYPCNGSVTWRLGDGAGRFISAVAQGMEALCQIDNNNNGAAQRKISPTVDSPCVTSDVQGTTCWSLFGYYNPNNQTIRIFQSASENIFVYQSSQAGSRTPLIPTQPQTFVPGRQQGIINATWPCSMGSLEWNLQGRKAVALINNKC